MELKQINSLVELFFKKYEEIILSNSKNIDDTFLVSLKEKNKGNKLFSYSWGVVNNKITVLGNK